jgi:hypothetical protein
LLSPPFSKGATGGGLFSPPFSKGGPGGILSAANLIIELDGGQHFSKENILKDEARDQFLNGFGFRVIRFSNSDVFNNIEGVVKEIYNHL